jgi:predicted DNA-binding ribbon-helix-helix protein
MKRRQNHYSRSHAVTSRVNGTNISIMLTSSEYEVLDAIARKENLSRAAIVRNLVLDRIHKETGG